MIAAKGGASEPLNLGLPGKAGGAAAVRRTLASTICRIADPTLVARPRQLRDVSTVMRFQPAHQSMINRRHDGRASCLARYSPKQALERKPRIYAPATWKGGHESGSTLTDRTHSSRHTGEGRCPFQTWVPACEAVLQLRSLAFSFSCPSFPRKREPRDFSHLLLGPRFRGDDELAVRAIS